MYLKRAIFILLVCKSLFLSVAAQEEVYSASSLFKAMETMVYQVKVIDIASDDKATIGSGFNAGSSGLVATNYHVISSALLEPDKYRISLVTNDEDEIDAKIVNVNVLHDLAILSPAQTRDSAISFAVKEPIRGERIFSIGNPQDLGMSVVEGNFNGLVKTSRFRRLLFSGSLNPGMSGGPAFNQAGELIGINVATGGEQLSFLVPAVKLQELISESVSDLNQEFIKKIENDLFEEQNQFYGELSANEWKIQDFGKLNLPHDLNAAMKCWGHNVDDEDIEYEAFHQHCRSEEYIYLDSGFYTGNFTYDYEWIESESLNAMQFYSVVESRFTHGDAGNAYYEEDTTSFSCESDFVEINDITWKVSSCFRRYLEFSSLYDATLLMVSLNDNNSAAVLKMGATGVSKTNALKLFEKLMGATQWKS